MAEERKTQEIQKSLARALSPFEEMDRIFDQYFRRGWMRPWRFEWPGFPEMAMPEMKVPKVNVVDRETEVVVTAEIPGVEKRDLDVPVGEDTVTIKGSTRHEEKRSAAALSKHLAQSLCQVPSVSRRILCPDRPAVRRTAAGPQWLYGWVPTQLSGASRQRFAIPGSSEEKGDYYRCEIARGAFSRTVALPATVDGSKGKASFKDGVLELTLPKVEKAKRHAVKVE